MRQVRGHTASMTAPESATGTDDPPVLYDVIDGVATIRLNRPEAMNSLDIATKELLRETVQQAADAVEAIVTDGVDAAMQRYNVRDAGG